MVVTVDYGIVDCFSVSRNFGCVRTIFGGVDEVEMVGACCLPVNVAVVAIKAYGESRNTCR